MKQIRFLPNCALLLALGVLAVVPHAFAQVFISPGTDEFFGAETIDGSFDDKLGDCDGVTNLCDTSANVSAGEVYTYSAAIFNQTQISTTVSGLYKEFTVPKDIGDEETVLDARITGSASWRGSFYIVDFTKIAFFQLPSLGAKAEGFVRISLVDVTDPDNPFDVGNDAIADFGCEPDREISGTIPLPLVSDGVDIGAEVGWCEEERSETFSFGARVIRGHTYEIQLSMVCQSTTGAPVTFTSVCTFNNNQALNLSDLLTGALGNLSVEPIKISLGSIALPSVRVPLPGWIVDALDIVFEDPPTSIGYDVPDINLPAFELPTDDVVSDFLTPVVGSVLDAAAPRIDTGFVRWDYVNVAIDPDLGDLVKGVERDIVQQINRSETSIVTAVDGVGNQVEEVRTGVADTIRLLHTPEGKRTSGPIAGYPDLCEGGVCNWND